MCDSPETTPARSAQQTQVIKGSCTNSFLIRRLVCNFSFSSFSCLGKRRVWWRTKSGSSSDQVIIIATMISTKIDSVNFISVSAHSLSFCNDFKQAEEGWDSKCSFVFLCFDVGRPALQPIDRPTLQTKRDIIAPTF